MTTNAIDLTAPDIGTGAVVMPYAGPKPAPRAPDVARINDGRRQLVAYPGWKIITERLAARRP